MSDPRLTPEAIHARGESLRRLQLQKGNTVRKGDNVTPPPKRARKVRAKNRRGKRVFGGLVIRIILAGLVTFGVAMVWHLCRLPRFSMPGHFVIGIMFGLLALGKMKK